MAVETAGLKTSDYLIAGLLAGLSNIAQNRATTAQLLREREAKRKAEEWEIIKTLISKGITPSKEVIQEIFPTASKEVVEILATSIPKKTQPTPKGVTPSPKPTPIPKPTPPPPPPLKLPAAVISQIEKELTNLQTFLNMSPKQIEEKYQAYAGALRNKYATMPKSEIDIKYANYPDIQRKIKAAQQKIQEWRQRYKLPITQITPEGKEVEKKPAQLKIIGKSKQKSKFSGLK
ncbi:MAG: hypothetical protein AB1567_10535 [bacterium]